MGRLAEPWAWDARKGWYAWVKGRRIRLASFAEGKRAAQKRLGELLADAESPTKGAVPLVGELAVEYLRYLRRRRDNDEAATQTKADIERRMAGFAEAFGDKPADAITPGHVEEWLATKTTWGATSRHDGVGAVKAMFQWALVQGKIGHNPVAVMKKPQRKGKRDRIPSTENVNAAFEAIMTPEFRDLLLFIHGTGCRPKEARTLEAKHLDRVVGRAVMAEHKTSRKTGKDRIIYLSPVAAEVAYRLADSRPEGPIFLNSQGSPWTHNAIGLAMRRLRQRMGLGKELVTYSLRHRFITDALAKGVRSAFVAELAGHSDQRMLGTYTMLSDHHDALRDASDMVRGEPKKEPSGP